MVISLTSIISATISLFLFVLSALPLKRALKIVKGRKVKFRKILVIIFVISLVASIINLVFNTWAGIVSFMALLFIYKRAFELKKWKDAFFVWLLQAIFIIISTILIQLVLNLLSG